MTRRSSRGGFALLTVLLMVAIFTVSAMVALEVVKTDITDVATLQRRQEALDAAEGGLMECINDRITLAALPTFASQNLASTYPVSPTSYFSGVSPARGSGTYTAELELLRMAPLLESSHTVVRAVVYQVSVEAKMQSGSSARVEAEIYRVVSTKGGTIQPRIHAR